MKHSLLDVTGIGPATARLFAEAGFPSVESIASAEPGTLANLRGIGPVRAATLRTEAQRLLAGSELVSADEPSNSEERARRLRKQAKQLRRQARQQTEKAELTKSKKKRERRLDKAAKLEAAAKKTRRKAKKLLAK